MTDGTQEGTEGCLSFPELFQKVRRAKTVTVRAYDLDGKLYVNRLMDRYARKALKQAKKSGWGVPGLTWMPGVDPDPFGH